MMIRRRVFLGSTLGALLSGGVYASALEPQNLQVERVRAGVRRLPEALHGFRIAVLSDFHLYPFTSIEFLRRAVTLANSLSPDLTVLLGDFVDSDLEAIHELAPLLQTLNAKSGVFAVLGNHDHYNGAQVVLEVLRKAGLPVLVNEAVSIAVGAAALRVAGVDSLSGRFDLKTALVDSPAGEPVLLLAHEPDVADRAAADGRVALQLSGHSHGGQVRLPGVERLALPAGARKYPFGSYSLGGLFLHTSRGLGTTGLPLRLGSPPEVSEVTLAPMA